MSTDTETQTPEPAAEQPVAKKCDAKTDKKPEAKKDDKKAPAAKKDDKKPAAKETPAAKPAKKEEEEIPMDNAAIKAYSSVIADAAEDSEPQQAVVYSQTIPDEERVEKKATLGLDPMGSMIQNEISSIKEASIKAAQESSEWANTYTPKYKRNEKKLNCVFSSDDIIFKKLQINKYFISW